MSIATENGKSSAENKINLSHAEAPIGATLSRKQWIYFIHSHERVEERN